MPRLLRLLLPALILPTLAVAGDDDPLTTLRPGHPRLLLTPEAMAEMRAAAASDPLAAEFQRQLIQAAEAQLDEPPIEYRLVGPRMLDQSRQALAHITTGAMAFKLTGDPRYARHAREVMLTAAGFPDWNPSHFLDVAEMATALGLGYDWLHDILPPAERTTIARALRDKALAYVQPAYGRRDPDRRSFPFVLGNLTNNWNQVCNGGFLIAALALAEDEPELAREVVAGVRELLPYATEAYEPDGAYPEGPVYWGYGTRYNILILAALESALGRDFGLCQRPGFTRTALFRLQVQGPTGQSFNFADGGPNLSADFAMTWLARRYDLPAVERRSRELFAAALARGINPADRFLATAALWFPRETGPSPIATPRDIRFDGPSKVALFRSARDDPNALWTGLKAGSNRVNHGHLDLGEFLLEADGVRWAVDLGRDDYDLPGYWSGETIDSPRWQYFRLNNRSHNTIAPGDDLQSPDADAPWLAYASTDDRAFGVADLTSAYPTQGRRFHRGVALLDRARVLVQDEVEGLAPGTPLVWRMFTPAAIRIEGQEATLTLDGHTLRVEILGSVNAAFSTRAATPPTAVEEQNPGITELRITVSTADDRPSDLRLAVLLTPVGPRWPVLPAPAVRALDRW